MFALHAVFYGATPPAVKTPSTIRLSALLLASFLNYGEEGVGGWGWSVARLYVHHHDWVLSNIWANVLGTAVMWLCCCVMPSAVFSIIAAAAIRDIMCHILLSLYSYTLSSLTVFSVMPTHCRHGLCLLLNNLRCNKEVTTCTSFIAVASAFELNLLVGRCLHFGFFFYLVRNTWVK